MNTFIRCFDEALKERPQQRAWLEVRSLYVGDLHNHCNISYGHGSLEKAIAFAEQQLDFFTVTGHFAWPDMESGVQPIPEQVQEYHRNGFAKLRRGWAEYQRLMKQSAETGIVPFASYEFHSFGFGDYTIIVKDLDQDLPVDPDGEDNRLSHLIETNVPAVSGIICMPHHIGYKTGFRGINWDRYRQQSSPLVEIMSMHGASESEYAQPSYLHTMGPKSKENTYQGGLARGHVFGVTASTDHHNASPGSYGSGKTGVWATAKESDAIWGALLQRGTVAYSGDPIAIAFFVEGAPIGSIVTASRPRVALDGYVKAPSSLSRVEVMVDNVVHSTHYPREGSSDYKRIDLSVGWGQRNENTAWKVCLSVEGGQLVDVVGRLRGEYVVDPLSIPKDDRAGAPHLVVDDGSVRLECRSAGNSTATTDDTQGFGFGVHTQGAYTLVIDVEMQQGAKQIKRTLRYASNELQDGATVEYMDGFVSPALRLSEEMDEGECIVEIHEQIAAEAGTHIYLRAFEEKGDSAWSSAIWVE